MKEYKRMKLVEQKEKSFKILHFLIFYSIKWDKNALRADLVGISGSKKNFLRNRIFTYFLEAFKFFNLTCPGSTFEKRGDLGSSCPAGVGN